MKFHYRVIINLVLSEVLMLGAILLGFSCQQGKRQVKKSRLPEPIDTLWKNESKEHVSKPIDYHLKVKSPGSLTKDSTVRVDSVTYINDSSKVRVYGKLGNESLVIEGQIKQVQRSPENPKGIKLGDLKVFEINN